MASAARNLRVLLLGGHGKIALSLTPLLLARSWDVVSVVRDAAQEAEILKLKGDRQGKVSVLVSSLEDVKSKADADKVIESAQPDSIVWAAGAGGKGPAQRTYDVDQESAKHFIHAAISRPSVTKFLMISHIGSRRAQAPWWNTEEWENIMKVKQILPDYYVAKLEADEYFTALAMKRREKESGDGKFQDIVLRPTYLSDEPATGKVELGHTKPGPAVSRADVAMVADKLLARSDTRGYLDLVGGETPVDQAIDNVAKNQVTALDGEDVDAIRARFDDVSI